MYEYCHISLPTWQESRPPVGCRPAQSMRAVNCGNISWQTPRLTMETLVILNRLPWKQKQTFVFRNNFHWTWEYCDADDRHCRRSEFLKAVKMSTLVFQRRCYPEDRRRLHHTEELLTVGKSCHIVAALGIHCATDLRLHNDRTTGQPTNWKRCGYSSGLI
jgi:hypothetical protein